MPDHTFVLSLADEEAVNAKGFEVAALRDCPHVCCVRKAEQPFTESLSCSQCGDSSEPWVCLTCFSIGCSRYVQSHGAAHALSTGAVADTGGMQHHEAQPQASVSNAAAGGAAPRAAPGEAGAHAIALSYADMSIWCYCCEAYLDVFSIRALHAPFRVLYMARFGEEPALPTS